MSNTKIKLVNSVKMIVLALIITIGMSYVVAWTGAPANPPSDNASAPLNVGNERQDKLGPLYLNTATSGGVSPIGLLVNGISKLYGNVEIGTTTLPASLKIVDGNQGAGRILTSNAEGRAGWQDLSAFSLNPPIVCTKTVPVTGQLIRMDHKIDFATSDCTGGVLPSDKYVGSLKKLAVCWGFTTITVNDKTGSGSNPGVTYYGNSLNTTDVYNAASCAGATIVNAYVSAVYYPISAL